MTRNQGYKGNPNLPRMNAPHNYTAHEIAEFIKCRDDPVYFAKTYIRIVNVDEGLVPFEMWDFQEKLIRTIHENRFTISKFPRQTGKSTTVITYLLHYILFNANVNVAVLANKAETARITLGRLQIAYEYLPDFIKQGIVVWNKGSIELANGSKIMAASTAASSVRGNSFNIIFLDEFAHVPNNIAEAFFNSTYPTVSSGESTKVIIVSTPLGLNMFYTMWQKAIDKKNDYIPIEVHWSDVPGRDEKWKQDTIANTSEELFRVEFECEFLGSTSTLINGVKLQALIAGIQNPIYTENGLKVFEHPIKGHVYTITVDTAQGLGLDASAFSVIDVTSMPYRQVARFKDNLIAPLIYPGVIISVAMKYNDAFVLVEINDVGQQIADIIHHEFGYDNLLKLETKNKMGQAITAGHKKRIQFGVRTNAAVKRIGCTNLKSIIENDKLLLVDEDTIMELTTFSVHNQSYQAEEGHKDDLVMSLVLFSWLSSQKFYKETINVDVRRVLQEEQMRIMDDDILPPPIINDGRNDSFRDKDGDLWVDARYKQFPFDDLRYDWGTRL